MQLKDMQTPFTTKQTTMNKIKEEHSKHYYDKDRNKCTTAQEILEVWSSKIPDYYKGLYGYEARKVISAFNLSYNVGTATTYLLRAGKKREQGMTDLEKHIEDLEKAKNHLDFEIERLTETSIKKEL